MRRLLIRLTGPTLLLLGFAGCASTGPTPSQATRFVVFFNATRTTDHASLASVSVPVNLGSDGHVSTDSKTAAENEPALPEFVVRLQSTRQPGVYELVTRVTVRELTPNKKGKLKRSQRFLGALVPTRVGATEIVSTESDPIHLEARLERR